MEMFREIIDFIGYIDYNKGIFLKKQTIFRRKRFGQRNSMFRRRDVAAHEEQQRRDTTMVTLQDIANQMGVSKSTVSKALNGASDISETLQKNILETAIAMGYSKIRREKTGEKKLCILMENIEYEKPHQFGYDFITGFRQMAEPAGYTVDVVPADEKLQKSISYDVFMLQNHYMGAYVLGFTLNDPWMKDFKTCLTPTALYDNYIKSNPCVVSVGIDNDEGMDMAVTYLKKQGHKKIGYLSGALGSFVMQVRHKSFFNAMRQNGLHIDPSLSGASFYITESMEKHVPRLLKLGATAIICSHDLLANAAMIQCQQLGYDVPGDISIIGFDDLPICPYTSPPMTSVRQDRIMLGKSGYYALASLLDQVPIGTLLLHASLVIRESTGLAKYQENP